MLAEYTWPDVAMALIEKVLVPLALLAVWWFKLRDIGVKVEKAATEASETKAVAVNAARVSAGHTEQIAEVKQELEANTLATKETLKGVDDLKKG